MSPRQPTIVFHGPAATHDQCCAVLTNESAVYDFGDGCYHPSWKAQAMGYHLIYTKTKFQRWLVRTFFKAGQ
jgi:hypothetical protein